MVIIEEMYKLKMAALLHDSPDKPFEVRGYDKRAKKLAERVLEAEMLDLLNDNRVRLADRIASSFDRWILSILMGGSYVHGLFEYKDVKIKSIVEPTLEKKIESSINETAYDRYVGDLKSILDSVGDWKSKYHLLYLFYEPLWISNRLPVGPADTATPTHSIFDHNYATAAMINWAFSGENRVKGFLVGLDVASIQEFISSSRKVRDMWISSYIVSALTWYTIVELLDKLGPDILIMPSMRMNPFYLHWLESKLDGGTRERIGSYMNQIEKLFYLSDKVLEMRREFSMSPYPLIPGKATLALPPIEYLKTVIGVSSGEELKRYFEERLRNGWSLLSMVVRKMAEKRSEKGDLIWNFINMALKYYDETFKREGADYDRIPPLKLRVEYVEIDEKSDSDYLWLTYDKNYRELSSKIGLLKYRREEAETELRLDKITEKAFDEEPIGFPKPSDRGFEYCTCCGKVPALLNLPARENEENVEEDEYGLYIYCTVVNNNSGGNPKECYRKLKNRDSEEFENLVNGYREWLNKAENRRALRTLKILFTPGEKLCPWCFLKRVLSLEPRILKVLSIGVENKWDVDKIVENILRSTPEAFTWFPSLAHIASTRLYEKIAQLNPKNLEEFINEADHLMERLILSPRGISTWTWQFMKGVYEGIEEKISRFNISDENKELFRLYAQNMILNNPEDLWFDPNRRRGWSQLLSKFDLSKRCWRYYALIKADGDSIGDLLEGKLTALMPSMVSQCVYEKLHLDKNINEQEVNRFKKYLSRYIKCSCEGELRDSIGFCVQRVLEGGRLESIERECGKEIIEATKDKIAEEEAHKRIERVKDVLREILNKELRIIVSPSYHVSISAALMRTALLDIAIISELDGFVVYAGGDDLLAFAPVDKALDIVYNTRKAFGGYSLNVNLRKALSKEEEVLEVKLGEGFLQIHGSYLSMLPSIGRSYAIYIAHYQYPLSAVINHSSMLLDNVKEKVELRYFDEKYERRFLESMKDIAVIAYNPRAAKEEYVLLPLSLHRPIIPLAIDECGVGGHDEYIASSLKSVKELLKFVSEKIEEGQSKLKHSLLYDAAERGFEEALRQFIVLTKKEPSSISKVSELVENIVKKLIERNIDAKYRSEAGDLSERVYRDILMRALPSFAVYYTSVKTGDARGSDENDVIPVLSNMLYAIKLIMSGMR
ncbi:MAG: type III-B CRISPR-associated protein Cas10/Cmr2 [Infirmifilum sp.]